MSLLEIMQIQVVIRLVQRTELQLDLLQMLLKIIPL